MNGLSVCEASYVVSRSFTVHGINSFLLILFNFFKLILAFGIPEGYCSVNLLFIGLTKLLNFVPVSSHCDKITEILRLYRNNLYPLQFIFTL